ncbi:MAG: SIS domain-containing protein [Pseudorhodoplanes sp.]|nr:SIS domain-containing protein [Pseudorhodoplanes sp.]
MTICACGTAYYAGLVGKYWFEHYARIPVDIDVASEFRYREVPLEEGGLAIFISQSGETADTLASLRYCDAQASRSCRSSTSANPRSRASPTSSSRPSGGPEIGVASTKAFTCQLAVLACLAIAAGRQRGVLERTTSSGWCAR